MAFSRRTTTQDISWFLDLDDLHQLNLEPPYQRRSVWSPKDRRFFLDTIFNGYPCPAIYVMKDIRDGKSIYEVIDGKQRLETILRFRQGKIAIGNDFGSAELAGRHFEELEEESKKKFYNYVMSVEFIAVEPQAQQINEVFDRLNRNSRKLTPQELRHAKYDGWFIGFVENEADNDVAWEKLKIVTTSKSRRMADVQNISELLMVTIARKVLGFKQETIDDYYAMYDDPAHDPVDGFDEDELKRTFATLREFLVKLEEDGRVISTYAKNFKDFYTLWGVLALNESLLERGSTNFASAYSKFMRGVEQYRNISDAGTTPPELITGDGITEHIKTYYRNSLGASTDFKQRDARHAGLLGHLIASE
jgi:hypothetical protein